MKCTNCGNEVQSSDTACQVCGTAISETVPKKPLVYREDTQDSYVWFVQKKLVYIIGAMIAAVIVMGFAGTFIASIFNRVDVTQYLQITADGYNGFGSIYYDLDEEALLCDLYSLEYSSELQTLSPEEKTQANKVIDALKKSITHDAGLENLSNGDERIFTFNNLNDIEKATGVKFRNKDQLSFKVETLIEATELSIESLFEVDFVGYDGSGRVTVALNPSDTLLFELSCYRDRLYIDDSYELEFYTSKNEGALSNGDTFSIGVRASSAAGDYLLSQYGIGLSEDKKMECIVDGLMASQEIDVFSMLAFGVSGLDGDAKTQHQWNETEKTFGDIRVVVDDPKHTGFYVNSKASIPSNPLSFASDDNAAGEEYSIGYFRIEADKNTGIGSGDEITFRITSSDGEAAAADALASSGVVFSSVEQKLTVDTTMLERYITSADQVNAQGVKALATALEADVTTYLNDNWSRIIHGNSSFICYDQTIKEGPTAAKAYFACTDANSNSYKLWILFTGYVTDSETTEAVPYYILAEANKPTIVAGEENVIHTLDPINFGYYGTMADLEAAHWYTGYMDVMTVITLA